MTVLFLPWVLGVLSSTDSNQKSGGRKRRMEGRKKKKHEQRVMGSYQGEGEKRNNGGIFL